MRGSPGRRKYACSECASPSLDGAARGDQRLSRHLTAEDALALLLRRAPAEQVHLELFEVEDLEQVVERAHRGAFVLREREDALELRVARPAITESRDCRTSIMPRELRVLLDGRRA